MLIEDDDPEMLPADAIKVALVKSIPAYVNQIGISAVKEDTIKEWWVEIIADCGSGWMVSPALN